ncbi:MAG: M48 family metallopeptidase [Solobacterium sp.]|nr:M48 family metallopeptidase [Solobacterium sp.]
MKIYLNQQEYELHIERKKRMKNMYLRLKGENLLSVTCSYRISNEAILHFVEEKASWIAKQQKKEKPLTMDQLTGAEGDVAIWLGKKYRVRYEEANNNFLFFDRDELVYFLKNKSKEVVDKTFYQFGKKQLELMILEQRKEWDQFICMMHGLPLPKIKVKYMTSQWGSCMPSKNPISISTRLIHYPRECLDYVLLHEYAHLLVPNHSEAFYQLVKSYMPKYKVYSNRLKEKPSSM